MATCRAWPPFRSFGVKRIVTFAVTFFHNVGFGVGVDIVLR